MATRITATEAARNFSDLLNRVRYAGESFLVVRNGDVICRIEPAVAPATTTVAELLEFLETAPPPDEVFADDLDRIQRKQPRLPRSPWAS